MNKYETIFIMDNKITEEQKSETINNITNYIKHHGTILKTEDLGLKKLAYEVKKCTQGYYYIIEFEAMPSTIQELERMYRITDEIIKFIVLKKD